MCAEACARRGRGARRQDSERDAAVYHGVHTVRRDSKEDLGLAFRSAVVSVDVKLHPSIKGHSLQQHVGNPESSRHAARVS